MTVAGGQWPLANRLHETANKRHIQNHGPAPHVGFEYPLAARCIARPAGHTWPAASHPTTPPVCWHRSGQSAIAYAVAKQLGYPAAKVRWVTASFNSVIQPGKKSFDFDINEISITPERAKAIDLSSGYYDVAQALVTVKGSGIEKVRTLAALANVKLGAQLGTTSYSTIINVIKPKSKAAVFDTNDLAVAALSAGQVKGIVTDLPTAFYLSASVKNALIVGQFATKAGQEPFGLALTKGSPLTACVSAAVDALRAKGELKAIADKWLTSVGGAPIIK